MHELGVVSSKRIDFSHVIEIQIFVSFFRTFLCIEHTSADLSLYHPGVVFANRRIRRVFRSWSRIFFSISASVSVSKNGAH